MTNEIELLLNLNTLKELGIAASARLNTASLELRRAVKNVSVDIGWLHVPMRLAEFSSVLTAGHVAQATGYAPIFAATGVFFAAFSLCLFNRCATHEAIT